MCPLAVRGLSYSFGPRSVFEDFELATAENRVVLKGPSGCGKTTLLRLLFGDLRANPGAELPELGRAVLVLQEDALFPWLSGRENIKLFLDVEDDAIARHRLAPVILPFVDRRVHQMSYGQRRSVELFRALLALPQTLLLDEPFNYLDDAKANAFIAELLSDAWNDRLVIVTSHRHDVSLDAASAVFQFAGTPPYSRLQQIGGR